MRRLVRAGGPGGNSHSSRGLHFDKQPASRYFVCAFIVASIGVIPSWGILRCLSIDTRRVLSVPLTLACAFDLLVIFLSIQSVAFSYLTPCPCWRSTSRERGPWRWSKDVLGSGVNNCRLFVARVRLFCFGLISPYKSPCLQGHFPSRNYVNLCKS